MRDCFAVAITHPVDGLNSKPAGGRKQFRAAARVDKARTDLTGLLWLIARRGPGLPNLCRLLVGRNALPEHPIHITLGGEASTSETPMRYEIASRLPS